MVDTAVLRSGLGASVDWCIVKTMFRLGAGTLQGGYVESSNVNVVEELVSMIQTQRAYEINSKAVQTSDQMLQRLTQMG